MIYGHIHNNNEAEYWNVIKNNSRMLNAGVDVNGFRPVSFDELIIYNDSFKQGLNFGDIVIK